jgi:hypothetical protein
LEYLIASRLGFAKLAILVALSLVSLAASAQVKRQIPAVATTTPPNIDGDLLDPAWANAPKATGFLDAVSGSPAEDQTTVSILYDEKYIYIAFDCKDAHPESITARDTVRDTKFQKQGERETEDNVEVDFDPFLTRSGNDLSKFSVNPLGTRSAAFAGGRGSKAEWTGEWEAAAKRNPMGWTAEMRIPWASLNYPTNADKITIGINFYRYIDRTKRIQQWSNVGERQQRTENEGLWTDVVVPKGAFRPKLSLLPYLLGGVTDRVVTGKAGLDMRYPITSQLTGVGSINPDFSGLEAALQSIAYSSTEQFLPEYRPFFKEGGEYFDIPWQANSFDLLFYSRRIPKFDLGTKLYGKLSPRDTVGFLNTYDFDGRNDTVMRYSRNYSETGQAGMMIVRKDSPDQQNTVTAVNNEFHHGKFGYDLMAANSMGRGAGGGLQVGSVAYNDKILTTILHYSQTSDNFLAPDAFIPIKGYKGYWYSNFLNYSWKQGFFTGALVVLNAIDFRRFDGNPYDREFTQRLSLFTRNDWALTLSRNDTTFEGLDDRTISVELTKGYRNRFQSFGLYVMTGETGSVPTTFISPTVKLRLFKKLDLLYSGAIQNRLGIQQQHITTLNYELSPTRSFGGRVVNQDSDTNAYLFYRNSGGRGTEYYFILGDPNARKTVRSLQLKMVFAF